MFTNYSCYLNIFVTFMIYYINIIILSTLMTSYIYYNSQIILMLFDGYLLK